MGDNSNKRKETRKEKEEETAMRNAYIRCKCGCFTRLNDADEWHCKKCGNVWD